MEDQNYTIKDIARMAGVSAGTVDRVLHNRGDVSPKSKAKVTSIYMMMGGLANFVIPLITGYLSNIGLQYIIVLDFTFALLALITAIIVFIRYYRVFIIPENDVRFGEHKFSTRLNTIKHRG